MPQHGIRYSINIVRLVPKKVLLIPKKIRYSVDIHLVHLQNVLVRPPTHPVPIEALQDTHTEGVEDFA